MFRGFVKLLQIIPQLIQTELPKIGHSGGILGGLLGLLLNTGSSLIRNLVKPLDKRVKCF